MKRSLANIMMAAAFLGFASTASPGEEIRTGGMLELRLHICSLVEGARCKEEKLSYMAETATPFQCFLYGQAEIAKWQEGGHPNWRVTRWSCGPARQMAKA